MSDYGYQPPPGGGGFGGPGAPPYTPPPQMTPVLNISDVFRDTGRILGQRFAPFAVIAAGFSLPSLIAGVIFALWQNKIVADAGGGIFALTAIPTWFRALNFVVSISTGFIAYLGVAVVTAGAVDHLVGRSRTNGELLSDAISHAPSILGLSLLNMLIAIGVLIPTGIVFAISAIGGPLGALCCGGSTLLAALGAYFYIIAILYVAMPVCVTERLGPIESMSRSTQMTKGHRPTLVGIMAILVLAAMAIIVPLFCCLGAGAASTMNFSSPEAMANPSPAMTIGTVVVAFPLQVISFLVTAALSAVVYVRLSGADRRPDGSSVAAVFQ